MDSRLVDRIATILVDHAPRRGAVKAALGTALATVAGRLGGEAAEAKKNKKRCRKRLKSCGGKKKCCNSGQTACQSYPRPGCETFSGKRCCGQEGASCDLSLAGCDCCTGLFCSEVDGEARCREPET